MKKFAVTVAVLALGLAACEGTTDDPAVEAEAAVEEGAALDVNAAIADPGVAAETALDNVTETATDDPAIAAEGAIEEPVEEVAE